MSTAPCPDPNENNEELFKAVDNAFEDISSFVDEDGNQRTVEFLDSEVIEKEVESFRSWLASTPSGVSPYEER